MNGQGKEPTPRHTPPWLLRYAQGTSGPGGKRSKLVVWIGNSQVSHLPASGGKLGCTHRFALHANFRPQPQSLGGQTSIRTRTSNSRHACQLQTPPAGQTPNQFHVCNRNIGCTHLHRPDSQVCNIWSFVDTNKAIFRTGGLTTD